MIEKEKEKETTPSPSSSSSSEAPPSSTMPTSEVSSSPETPLIVNKALEAFEAHDIERCVELLVPLGESTFIPGLMLLRTLRLSYPWVCTKHGLSASAEALTRRINEAPNESYAAMEDFLAAALPAASKAGAFLRASWLSFARGDAASAQPLYAEAAPAIPSAKVNMAAYIENALGDGPEAFRMYTDVAAADGHAMARYNRAVILLAGKYGVAADVPQALGTLEELAAAKLSAAQYTLGMWRLNNKVPGGLELLTGAAEQGHESAMLSLGQCYHTGKYGEIPRDPELAVSYYDAAAREGNAEAQYCLAVCYQEGFGVKEKDFCEAAILLHLAAQQGHAGAQVLLGVCYKTGKGVPVNHNMAAGLFEAAAKKGKTVAMCNLAMCYKTGKGVEKDEAKCRELFEKAAALGDMNAKRFLETMK